MAQPPNTAQKPSEQRESQTPLQILPAMLHAVFCQTADVFNAPQRQQPRAVIYTNAQIRTSVSVCNERFQYALDLLEMDILKAKATLRRDLSLLRAAAEAESAAREAALQQERDRLAAIAAAKKAAEERAAEERAAEEIRKKQEAERKAAEEKEQEMKRRQQAIFQQEQQQQQQREHDTVMIDSTPPSGQGGAPDAGFDFLFDEEKPAPAQQRGAPPAPMHTVSQVPAANLFEDFLANFPVGGGAGDDGTMGGGQPLEESDLFEDLFMLGGT